MTLSECYIHMLLIIYSLFCLVHGFIIVRYLSYEFLSLPIVRRCQLMFLMEPQTIHVAPHAALVEGFTVLMLDQRMNVTISLFLFSIFKIDHSFTDHLSVFLNTSTSIYFFNISILSINGECIKFMISNELGSALDMVSIRLRIYIYNSIIGLIIDTQEQQD